MSYYIPIDAISSAMLQSSTLPDGFWEDIKKGGIALLLSVLAVIALSVVIRHLYKSNIDSKQKELDKAYEMINKKDIRIAKFEEEIKQKQESEIVLRERLIHLIDTLTVAQGKGTESLASEISRAKDEIVKHIDNLPLKLKKID